MFRCLMNNLTWFTPQTYERPGSAPVSHYEPYIWHLTQNSPRGQHKSCQSFSHFEDPPPLLFYPFFMPLLPLTVGVYVYVGRTETYSQGEIQHPSRLT